MTREVLLARAATVAGAAHVRAPRGPSDIVDGSTPAVVIEPSTIDQVSATLAWASSAGLAVVLRGAGTRDSWGRPPGPVDVLLRFSGLNRLIEHEASDLTATVEAGARLSDLNRRLEQHNQHLPLDGAVSEAGTVGGLLATNDTGPLRHHHGAPRDLLIGMTVVMADGLIASSGGRVVKNVAGYDIGRLVTGSHGALAAIVSATFKLAPVAPHSLTIRVRVRRPSDVTAFTDLLRQAQCEPEALDLHVSHTGTGRPDVSVLVRFASVKAAVEDAIRASQRCAHQVDGTTEIAEGAQQAEWWRLHQAAPRRTGGVLVRLSWRPSEFDRTCAALIEHAADAPIAWSGRAAAGSGLLGIGGDRARHAGIIQAVRENPGVRHVTMVDAPAALRHQVDVWQITSSDQALWGALKNACDPRDTLGAGRGPL